MAGASVVQETIMEGADGKVFTIAEIQNIERQNIIRALNQCSWKISGANGAAQLLGVPPSTLHSRIKALNITRE